MNNGPKMSTTFLGSESLVSSPPKCPLGLFPKPLQPNLELIRLEKGMFRYYPAHFASSFILNSAHWYNSHFLAIR